jgi:hypothetical protein
VLRDGHDGVTVRRDDSFSLPLGESVDTSFTKIFLAF